MNKPLTEKESKIADLFLEFLLTLDKNSAFKSIVNTFFEKRKVNKERGLAICKYLERKSLITLMLDSNEELRNLNFDISKIKDFLKNDRVNKIWITENKLLNDSTLSKWQVKTFWPIFIFAFVGFGFSVFNFISTQKTQENTKLQEQRIEKMESELTKLHISISSQKDLDSSHNHKLLTKKIDIKE